MNTKLRALIIDDEELARRLTTEYLRSHSDIEIIGECENGIEAVDAITTLQPDLIFLDIQMPKLNGLQLLKALREYQPTRQCCFILVTGKGDRALIEEGKKYGLNNFLAKPFTAASLKAAIEAVVGKLV